MCHVRASGKSLLLPLFRETREVLNGAIGGLVRPAAAGAKAHADRLLPLISLPLLRLFARLADNTRLILVGQRSAAEYAMHLFPSFLNIQHTVI